MYYLGMHMHVLRKHWIFHTKLIFTEHIKHLSVQMSAMCLYKQYGWLIANI